MRAPSGILAAVVSSLALGPVACSEPTNVGVPPPEARFFFPSGMLLDPVDRDGGPEQADPTTLPPQSLDLPGPRYLFVANGNNDRSYNSGRVMAVDLRAFWRAWYDPHRFDPAQPACLDAIARARAAGSPADLVEQARDACAARDPRRGGVDPYCHEVTTPDGTARRCVQLPGSVIAEGGEVPEAPCRRLPLVAHIAECDERAFVVDSVRVGDFATTMTHSMEDGAVRLWLPVRGDPSVTFIDVVDDGEAIALRCEQGDDDLCGDDHRLDQLRNDPDALPLDREPFNMAIWERDPAAPGARGQRLGFVAHAAGSELTLVDLDGLRGDDQPAIVDFTDIYQALGSSTGGFGLAVRPCFEAGQGPLGAADPAANVPAITRGCTRPLVYTSHRFVGRLASFTASGLELGGEFDDVVPPEERTGCTVEVSGAEVYAGPYCATVEQLEQPCAVSCEPRVRAPRPFAPPLLMVDPNASGAVLGAIAFADPRGDQLLVLQTNPGALLTIDTSIGPDGEPLDIPSAPPLEICAEPSLMAIYAEPGEGGMDAQRYALISCFRAALVYVVDLEALRVVDQVVVGTGPHDVVIDQDREAAYVINNLESSVSVIDLSRRRGTRFQELARLGLQDPFSQ